MSSKVYFEEKHIVFYDFETNGKRPFYTSAIMQVAFQCSTLGLEKNIYVYPYDNMIGGTEIHNIDEKTLEREKAISSKELLTYFLETFHKKDEIYYFLAYNNFGFDQNVLEYHFKYHKMDVPQNWFFIDIMPYIQRYYPNIRKNGGYKLSNVYDILCEKSDNQVINFHNALDDVYALSEIFKSIHPEKKKLQEYIRGSYRNRGILLSPISTIAGYAHFFDFEKNDITHIQDLYSIYIKCQKKSGIYKRYLKEKIGIYSEFYLQKIIEQTEILNDLLEL